MPAVMSNEINKYLDEVCDLVRNKRVHGDIREEITNHIEELTQDYIDVGLSDEEAVRKAIEQMGPANVVGTDLNKIHKAVPDWVLIGMTAIFILVGFVTLGFIQKNNIISNNYNNMISNMSIYAVGGVLISILLLRIDYRDIKKYSIHIYIASVGLLISSFFISNYVGGYIGWVSMGNITFNVFTVAPFFLIIALAGIFDGWDWKGKKSIIIGVQLTLLPCIFFVLGKSLVNLVIYVVAALTIMFISDMRLKHILISVGTIIGAFTVYLLTEPYRMRRIMTFLSPEQDMSGSGWIYNQMAALKSNAGLFGQARGFSYSMLPDAHTDFIFTFLIYCFGWAAGIILIALILAFIVRIFYVGTTIKEKYGKLLVNGFCALFLAQFTFSLGVNLNLMPVVAVSMPFISYGGSSLVINILSIGVISNVFKWRNTPYKVTG